MKRIVIILSIILLLLSLSVFSANEQSLESLNQELAGKEIPAPLDKLLADEKINLYFTLANGEEVVLGLTTAENKFSKLSLGELDNPSLRVYTTEEVITEIENSENPAETLNLAFKEGKIRYEAVGFLNKIKFGILSTIIKVGSWFAPEKNVEDEIDASNSNETTNNPPELTNETETDNQNNQTTEEPTPIVEEEVEEKKIEPKNKTYLVKMTNDGFGIDATLNIKIGDTVKWENVRTGALKKAMIVGAQACSNVKSNFFESGESFSWTFKEPITCTIVDGVFTTETMKVSVK